MIFEDRADTLENYVFLSDYCCCDSPINYLPSLGFWKKECDWHVGLFWGVYEIIYVNYMAQEEKVLVAQSCV